MEVLAKPAPLFSHELRTADALVFVSAPDNTRSAAAIEPSGWEPSRLRTAPTPPA